MRHANLNPGDVVVWRRPADLALSRGVRIRLDREEISIGVLLEKVICGDPRSERSAARVLFGSDAQWVPLWQLLPVDKTEDRQGQGAPQHP